MIARSPLWTSTSASPVSTTWRESPAVHHLDHDLARGLPILLVVKRDDRVLDGDKVAAAQVSRRPVIVFPGLSG
jgi:hypothetical protein